MDKITYVNFWVSNYPHLLSLPLEEASKLLKHLDIKLINKDIMHISIPTVHNLLNKQILKVDYDTRKAMSKFRDLLEFAHELGESVRIMI